MNLQAEQTISTPEPMEKVASGQRLIILAMIILILAAFGVFQMIGLNKDFNAIVDSVFIAMSIAGMFRIASGLSYSTGVKIALVILLLTPLAGMNFFPKMSELIIFLALLIAMVTMVVLNSRANKALKAAGYKVGFLGARR